MKSIAGAIFSAKKGKSTKREAAQMKQLSSLAAAQPEEIRTRRTAAEETYSKVLNRLGAAGTYENVGGAPSPSIIGPSGQEGPESPTEAGIFKTEKVKGALATDIDRRYSNEAVLQDVTRLDPDKTLKALEGSSQFRTMSRLQAEAEQLVARQGPLWDEMIKNQQLPIIEGAAAMARENAEDIRRAFAKGGAARRTAFETIEKIRGQERINSTKIQQIANARVALDKWSRENAQSVLKFGQNWTANLGGIREKYNKAMDSASELMLESALPIMVGTTQRAAAYRRQAHEKNRDNVMRWVKGVVGAVALYYGQGGIGSNLLGQAVGGTSKSGESGEQIGGAVGGIFEAIKKGKK